MDEFNYKYKQILDNVSGTLGNSESTQYCHDIQNSIDKAINSLNNEARRRGNVDIDYLKGWLAEHWHAGTFNINGEVRGNRNVWAIVADNNKAGEDIYYGNGNNDSVKIAELKYYKNGPKTGKAISRPDYINKEKIVPSDQLESVRESAQKNADKIKSYRPSQSEHYQDTANRADDKIRMDNVSSKPLDESKAKEMAKDYKRDGKIDSNKYGLNTEEFVSWNDIARQSGKAALHAAVLSAAITAAPYIWNILIDYIENGEIDFKDISNIEESILIVSVSSGLRGGVAAALTIAFKSGLMGDSLKQISPIAIGMATTMAINTIGYSLKLNKGEITQNQFVNLCIKDSFILSTSMAGAAVGQLIIPIPLLGALVGNLIGATLGGVIYEGINHKLLGLSIENGWTFFGLVDQNYIVDEDILRQVGYDLININTFHIQKITIARFIPHLLSTTELNFTILKRGIVASNVIGYR